MRYVSVVAIILSICGLAVAQSRPASEPTPVQLVSPFGWSLEQYKKKPKKKADKTGNGSPAVVAPQERSDDDVLKISTQMVVGGYLVTNQNGQVVDRLKADDFVISDNGELQAIDLFSVDQIDERPRSIVLILEATVIDKPRFPNSLRGAKGLIDKLFSNDRLSIVTSDLRVELPFTSDKRSMLNALDSLSKNAERMTGNGDLETLVAVLNELFDGAEGEKLVICQCDGSQATWLKRDGSFKAASWATIEASGAWRFSTDRNKLFSDISFANVKDAVIRSGATIYPIVPGRRFLGFDQSERLKRARLNIKERNEAMGYGESGLDHLYRQFQYGEIDVQTLGQEMLKAIADLSGGNMGFIEKPEDAEKVYDELFQVLDGRYLIGYYPKSEGKPGERRRIKVEVKGRPDLKVHGRTEYIVR